MSGAPARPAIPGWVGFVLTIAVVWLGGQFVTQGVSDQFLATDPEVSVLWRGDSSDALAAMARLRLGQKDNGGAKREAIAALRRAPLNNLALTTLGLAEDGLGQSQAADATLELSSQRNWRDPLTQLWLFKTRLLQAKFDEAFQHADAFMRRQNASPPTIYRILGTLARDPKAVDPLVQRLTYAPSWRTPFLIFLSVDGDPHWPDVEQTLLTRLAAGPTPPTDEELGPFLSRLTGAGRYADAEAAWRTLAHGADQGLVHDGDFSQPPAGTPFDWTFTDGVGWSTSIAAPPGGARGMALKLEYDGLSPPHPMQQLIVLPPGQYRLTGRLYEEAPGVGASHVMWQVVCADTGQVIASVAAPEAAANQWRDFGVDISSPLTGCPAQWLRLTAEAGDKESDVDVWYGDLAITPTAAAAPVASPATGR